MARQEIDPSGKWLVKHQGKGILYLGGLRDVRRWQAVQSEVVQPKQLPDGLLEVYCHGRKQPDYAIIEIATYPEKRVLDQALDDLMLTFQALHVLPELIVLVLRPKGRLRVGDRHEVQSRLGLSSLAGKWRPVELWTVPAEDLLATGDVGLVPWVPLTDFTGRPETLLRRCRERIEEQAHPRERANLLAVTQVLTRLRFPNPQLLALLGGTQAMFESPLIKELQAQTGQEYIVAILQDRFGEIPLDVTLRLQQIVNEKKLRELLLHATKCRNLEAFQARLLE